jgi:undecaprenyl-diphosphatase
MIKLTLDQIFTLGILQGFTEFLPISSSGHLILVEKWIDVPKDNLSFDIAVHVGTLTAVVTYFFRDVRCLLVDWSRSILKRQHVGESQLAWFLIIASIPVGAAGLLLHDVVESAFRNELLIAWATIGFGVILWYADFIGRRQRKLTDLGMRDALLVGFAQALALIPGTSRSGITMTAGLLLGMTRQAAARFSFLLSIPAIIMAGGYESLKLLEKPAIDWHTLFIGFVISAVTAFICIHFFLKLLDRIGMVPFVIYRLLLGAVILAYVYSSTTV